MKEWILVFLGSGLGGSLRYGIGLGMSRMSHVMPIHTLIANMLACIILGYVMCHYGDNHLRKLFFVVGFCGGLSTFSSLSYELFQFYQSSDWVMMIIYSTLSFFLCLLMIGLGFYIGAKF